MEKAWRIKVAQAIVNRGKKEKGAGMTQEALKLALEALENHTAIKHPQQIHYRDKAIAAIKEALAQTQEPVAWLITDEKINSLQVDSIQRLIDRARHAHMTDIKLRINGQDEWHQADWLKHLTRTTPPQSEQEPVAWRWQRLGQEWILEGSLKQTPIDAVIVEPLYTHPPQRTEPPDWFPAVENILKEYGLQAIDFVADFKAAMKDAEQSQRTWVGLTVEEIAACCMESTTTQLSFYNAIEAKLKEKNT
jgi:hypothetical protein